MEELIALPLIGEERAAAIIQHRDERGPFQTMEDLGQVEGIEMTTIKAIDNVITTRR